MRIIKQALLFWDKARRSKLKKGRFLLGRVNDIRLMLTIGIGQVVMRACRMWWSSKSTRGPW